MLKIRLKRIGRKNRPFFRIVVIESHRSTQGRFIETVGHFNPRDKKNTLSLKAERIGHWLKNGAKASDVVHNILVKKGIIAAPKIKVTN